MHRCGVTAWLPRWTRWVRLASVCAFVGQQRFRPGRSEQSDGLGTIVSLTTGQDNGRFVFQRGGRVYEGDGRSLATNLNRADIPKGALLVSLACSGLPFPVASSQLAAHVLQITVAAFLAA